MQKWPCTNSESKWEMARTISPSKLADTLAQIFPNRPCLDPFYTNSASIALAEINACELAQRAVMHDHPAPDEVVFQPVPPSVPYPLPSKFTLSAADHYCRAMGILLLRSIPISEAAVTTLFNSFPIEIRLAAYGASWDASTRVMCYAVATVASWSSQSVLPISFAPIIAASSTDHAAALARECAIIMRPLISALWLAVSIYHKDPHWFADKRLDTDSFCTLRTTLPTISANLTAASTEHSDALHHAAQELCWTIEQVTAAAKRRLTETSVGWPPQAEPPVITPAVTWRDWFAQRVWTTSERA